MARAQAPEPSFYRKANIRVPMEIVGDMPYVYLSVNRSDPLPFLVDSGSEMTTLSSQAVDQLGLATHVGADIQTVAAGGVLDGGNAWVSGVVIVAGHHAVIEGTLPVTDMATVRKALHVPVAGVLGFDVLKAHTVILDFRLREMLIFRKPLRKQLASATVLGGSCGANPFIEAPFAVTPKTDLTPAKFMLDTGNNASVVLNRSFAQGLGLYAKAGLTSSKLVGLSGEFPTLSGLTADLGLGRSSEHLTDVEISKATAGKTASSDFAGLIGAPVLRRYRVIFNCPEGTLALME